MTCAEANAFLADYLAGELAADAREAFDAHLAGCAECLAFLRSYAAAIRLGRVAAGDDEGGESPPVPPELVEAILRARRSAPRR